MDDSFFVYSIFFKAFLDSHRAILPPNEFLKDSRLATANFFLYPAHKRFYISKESLFSFLRSESYLSKIKVLVSGASGRMGREVCKAVLKDSELQLVGAVDKMNIGKDIGALAGFEPINITVQDELSAGINSCKPQVVVDFTAPATVMDNIRKTLAAGVHMVVGTTGLTPENLQEIGSLCSQYKVNALVAPNFAVGALLMMQFAAKAAKYFPHVEIIELHHDQKLDAPSGTSIKTAEMILAGRDKQASVTIGEEKIKGVRGGEMNGIHLHSVR